MAQVIEMTLFDRHTATAKRLKLPATLTCSELREMMWKLPEDQAINFWFQMPDAFLDVVPISKVEKEAAEAFSLTEQMRTEERWVNQTPAQR